VISQPKKQIGVRRAIPADADLVCAFVAALSAEEGMDPPALTPALFRRQGFGEDALFRCLVAECGDRMAGMVLLTPGYDSQTATGGLMLENIYVEPGSRRLGVGRALMAAAGRMAQDQGLSWICWHTRPANIRAGLFYRALGARTENVTLLGIDVKLLVGAGVSRL
jgi:GNAT superfamily N-acetyltransferase